MRWRFSGIEWFTDCGGSGRGTEVYLSASTGNPAVRIDGSKYDTGTVLSVSFVKPKIGN